MLIVAERKRPFTHGLAGTFTFTVTATDSAYTTTTAPAAVPGDGSLSTTVGDLPAGARFSVRANVTTTAATTHSQPTTFATPAAAPYAPPTRPAGGGLEAYTAPTAPRVVNRFQIKASTVARNGRRATLTLTLPGPGVVRIAHRHLETIRRDVEGGTVKLRLSLNKAGLKALRRSKRRARSVAYTVRYTPTGGATARARDVLTFKRKAAR